MQHDGDFTRVEFIAFKKQHAAGMQFLNRKIGDDTVKKQRIVGFHKKGEPRLMRLNVLWHKMFFCCRNIWRIADDDVKFGNVIPGFRLQDITVESKLEPECCRPKSNGRFHGPYRALPRFSPNQRAGALGNFFFNVSPIQPLPKPISSKTGCQALGF